MANEFRPVRRILFNPDTSELLIYFDKENRFILPLAKEIVNTAGNPASKSGSGVTVATGQYGRFTPVVFAEPFENDQYSVSVMWVVPETREWLMEKSAGVVIETKTREGFTLKHRGPLMPAAAFDWTATPYTE